MLIGPATLAMIGSAAAAITGRPVAVAAAAGGQQQQQHGAAQLVERSHCHVGQWDAAPRNVPLDGGSPKPSLSSYGGVVDGPLSGNGDFGLVVGTNEHTPTASQGSWLLMYVDTMHFRDVSGDTGQVYCGYDTQSAGKRGVGFLKVGPVAAAKANATSMEQHMANATVTTTQRFDSFALHTRSFVAATENVMVTELWCSGRPCKIVVETNPIGSGGASTFPCILQNQGKGGPGAPAASQWFNRSIGRGFRGAQHRHPRAVMKTHEHRVAVGTTFIGLGANRISSAERAANSSASAHVLSLDAGQVATVITALHTNREFLFRRDTDADEPLRSVGHKLSQLSSEPTALAGLRSAHIAWWRRHWAASGVKFGLDSDGQMSLAERMWYGTVYMLTITNRVNYTTHTPPSGLWHNFYTSDNQGWPGYTTDINTQSPYFGAAAANHAETELAMIDLHDQFIPLGRRISALAYNCTVPGVLLPVEIDAYGATKIWDDQGLKSNAILMAMVHVNHGRLTGQIDGQVYRFLREVAAFWECYLIKTSLPGGEYVYNDMNDCPYEICSADHYDNVDGKPVFYESVNNPTNSLSMIKTLLEALLDFSQVLDVDELLRPQWRDILQNLAPFPTNRQPADSFEPGNIFVDWDGAANPPKADNQMLGVIQLIYPAGRVSSSSANRTLFRTARNTMDYVGGWKASSDAGCIIYQISTRLNYNQTEIYPDFAYIYGAPRPDASIGNLFENGLTQAQNAGGGLQYVNELLVRSDEPFVRFFPGHFSSIAPAQHGLPLTDLRGEPEQTPPVDCDITGVWYDLHNAFPKNKFELNKTGPNSWKISQPNEWHCEVFVNRSYPPGTPVPPPAPSKPRIPGHDECGIVPAKPSFGTNTTFGFFWPAHGQTEDTLQELAPSSDCQNLCFTNAKASAQAQGMPYSRSRGPSEPGVCDFADGGSGNEPNQPERPWLNSSFSGMRVKGAQGTVACPLSNGLCTFLVGASLSAHGVVGSIDVLSERGGNFTFLSPYSAGSAPVVTERSGAKVPCCKWAPVGLFHLEPHETVWAFETERNTEYVISNP